MIKVFRKVSFGLRTRGIEYLYHAPINEFQNPRLGVTRALRGAIVSMRDRLAFGRKSSACWSDGALLFVYDLAIAPVTFDFISYLAAAELSRRRKGLAHIDVVFIAGPHEGLRKEVLEYEAEVDFVSRNWRVRNMLVPAISLLPSVRSYAMCASREQAQHLVANAEQHIYPPDYRLDLPCQPAKSCLHEMAREDGKVWPMLKAGAAAQRYIGSYLDKVAGQRRPLVISLRNYGFERRRNSKTADWIAFADRCDKARYAPIFVPDVGVAMTTEPADLGNHPICFAACWNLELRMALYEAAWLNMGMMQGPLELCWLNENARYLIFLPMGGDAGISADALTEQGIRVGRTLDFAAPHQRIMWEPDELTNIEAAFASFSQTLPDRATPSSMPAASPTP